jgi:hypothetical protein
VLLQVLRDGQCSRAADVYAFGVICWVGGKAYSAITFCDEVHKRAALGDHHGIFADVLRLKAPEMASLTHHLFGNCFAVYRSCGTSAQLWLSWQQQVQPIALTCCSLRSWQKLPVHPLSALL